MNYFESVVGLCAPSKPDVALKMNWRRTEESVWEDFSFTSNSFCKITWPSKDILPKPPLIWFFSNNIRLTLPLLPFTFWLPNMIVEIKQAIREKVKYGLADFSPYMICGKVLYVPESWLWFASKNLTPCWMHWNGFLVFLIGQIIAYCHRCPNVWHAIGESQPFGWENLFRPKKHLKTAISRRKISASPHFGKIWRPNCWHQVNFWGTPEKFGV